MRMRKLLVLGALFFTSCNNEGGGNEKNGDSNVLAPVNDTTQLSDTDDYNKPSPETTPLDAPPDYSSDSSRSLKD